MATQIQRRRGTTAQHATFTGAIAEITIDTDKNVVVVHDGVTAGGVPHATEASVTNHITDAIAAHAATAISNTPAGNIAATTVQAAINELDTEKALLAGSTSQAFSTAALTTTGLFNISGAAAGQIQFPATQNASANANTLDDYEEGTFTPTIIGLTSAGTGTYTTQIGRYTKIGNRVSYSIALAWSAHTGTGNIRVDGLPFTAANVGGHSWPAAIIPQNLTFSNTIACYVTQNTTSIQPVTISTGAASALITMDTTGSLDICGNYETP